MSTEIVAEQPAAPPTEGDQEEIVWLDELTPRQIVAELDKYIVGQDEAKKSVAIVLRNRWRRQRVEEEMRAEIAPNNLILIGPTGVGKTEIARRLAGLAGATSKAATGAVLGPSLNIQVLPTTSYLTARTTHAPLE